MSFSFCCCPADVTVISNVAQTLKYPAIEEPSSVHSCNHVSVNKRDISTIININKKEKGVCLPPWHGCYFSLQNGVRLKCNAW